MKWQPIETAPTDGTRILLCGRDGKIADGHYGQPDGFANPKRFVWPYIHANPTHWAPLSLIAAAPELLDAAMKVNALSIQTDAHNNLPLQVNQMIVWMMNYPDLALGMVPRWGELKADQQAVSDHAEGPAKNHGIEV